MATIRHGASMRGDMRHKEIRRRLLERLTQERGLPISPESLAQDLGAPIESVKEILEVMVEGEEVERLTIVFYYTQEGAG